MHTGRYSNSIAGLADNFIAMPAAGYHQLYVLPVSKNATAEQTP